MLAPNAPRLSENLIIYRLFWALRICIIVALPLAAILGRWEAFFISLVALIMTFVPLSIDQRTKVSLPLEYHAVIVVFLYASLFLGSALGVYEKYFWWDALLHTVSGIVLAFAAYVVLYSLYARKKLDTTPFIIAVFTFSFALALGGLWEIAEFAVDSFVSSNLQRSGLQDTMWDLIVDALGALGMSYVAYRHVQQPDKYRFVSRLLDKYLERNR